VHLNSLLCKGMEVVRQIEGLDTADNDKPLQDVIIAECGVLPAGRSVRDIY
jgi:hypothetical protein